MSRFLTLPFLLALSGCSLFGSDNGPDIRYFVARVDSITVPASVRASDTLTVSLHGWLGSNGCYGLERFEATREPSRLELKVIGRVARGGICSAVAMPLPAAYEVAPPLEGPFEVVIRQPDGSALERMVEVVGE